jgi:signal transduction histidine kinase
MPSEKFTVDSALLRELGERLVGKPHVALAELIKNSYDADASKVTVTFDDDVIAVSDNGHGMSYDDFKKFWMRIGTPHKQRQLVSQGLKRPLTGSKGVGRLAAQFLSSKIEFDTVRTGNTGSQLSVRVDWDRAVSKGTLTEATASYIESVREVDFPDSKKHGMTIRLSGLKQIWDETAVVELAKEIWMLQPPFGVHSVSKDGDSSSFQVEIFSSDPSLVDSFEKQAQAALENWNARLVGKLQHEKKGAKSISQVNLSLTFADGSSFKQTYAIANCHLHELDFEIRIFHLQNRQPHGITVADAREYFNKFGGVHIYDAGFRLPYYGLREADWLSLEFDHSHRLSASKLLPENLQVSGAMNFLPTNSRIYGVVNVNTAREQAVHNNSSSSNPLTMSVTRDRLTDNIAFGQLRNAVRWAIDYYALEEAKNTLRKSQANKPTENTSSKLEKLEDVLNNHAGEIPENVRTTLENELREAVEISEAEQEFHEKQLGLMGALATAGMAALAFEHEFNREMRTMESLTAELQFLSRKKSTSAIELKTLYEKFVDWLERVRSSHGVFSWLMASENREAQRRYKARVVAEDVKKQLGVFAKQVEIDISEVPSDLRLPKGSYAEWCALFQNLFINAINATLDCEERYIAVSHQRVRGRQEIWVQDTGVGIDLDRAERFFEPFERELEISPDRRSMGVGGTGLGLTIVRMIAESSGSRVEFVAPDDGFATACKLSWKE